MFEAFRARRCGYEDDMLGIEARAPMLSSVPTDAKQALLETDHSTTCT